MRVLVDTNVLADVVHNDRLWVSWAQMQLARYAGGLVTNPMVYAELCYHAESTAEVDGLVAEFGLVWEELPRQALFLASRAYQVYRKKGGTKSSPLPDFFIGAHAQVLGIPILTRDAGRYKTYFPTVPLISP